MTEAAFTADERRGRLGAQARTPRSPPPPSGRTHPVPLAGADVQLHVPGGCDPARANPLLVMLHGAGGRPDQAASVVRAHAERLGFLVLAPRSQAPTWDLIRGGFGPDVRVLDRALDWTLDRFSINPIRTGIGGFSDGASYALSIGLANGDRFSDVLAFSPGFAAPADVVGAPRIFISHGRSDEVLPFERCGAAVARRLDAAGYDVEFRPFAGGHVVPADQVDAAVRRFLRDARGG